MIKLPGLLLIGNRFISPKKLEQDKYYRLLTHLFYKDAYFGCSYPSITVYNCLNDIKKTNKHYYKTLYKLRNNYKQFLDLLTDNFYYLDKTNEYIPQGICSIDRSILVSMYDAYGKQKSKIVIVDKKKEVLLDIPIGAHVGGITYDEKNNLVWATNTSGRVSSFSYHDLINKDEATPQYTYKTDLLSASFITYYDGCMYVGSFNNSSNGKVISYIVNDDGTIGKKIEHFTLPSKVQGIAFYKKDEIYGEDEKLCALMTGEYYIGINNKKNVDFFIIKGVAEEVLDYLGYNGR
mgnify:CR=1 FL=1